jgi:hypothetical protein
MGNMKASSSRVFAFFILLFLLDMYAIKLNLYSSSTYIAYEQGS